MANPNQIKVVQQGTDVWNAWRREETSVIPDFYGANLIEASLSKANLREANFSGADLNGAILTGATLCEANLTGANLFKADCHDADLRQTSLIDSCLDGADITESKLWETQRGGWSINGVICQRVFWDRGGTEPTQYGGGDFERIFAEKPRIVLCYPGGMLPVDFAMLPLTIERLQATYPN